MALGPRELLGAGRTADGWLSPARSQTRRFAAPAPACSPGGTALTATSARRLWLRGGVRESSATTTCAGSAARSGQDLEVGQIPRARASTHVDPEILAFLAGRPATTTSCGLRALAALAQAAMAREPRRPATRSGAEAVVTSELHHSSQASAEQSARRC